jgi:hypothetical protein
LTVALTSTVPATWAGTRTVHVLVVVHPVIATVAGVLVVLSLLLGLGALPAEFLQALQPRPGG